MKYKRIKYVSILFIVLSIITICKLNTLTNYEKKEKNLKLSLIDINSKEFKDDTKKALEETFGQNYEKILEKNYQSVEYATEVDNLFKNNDGKIEYPDFFGGQYINDDNNLVIQIAKKNPAYKINFTKVQNDISKISDTIIFEDVTNSYSELEDVNNQIINYFRKNGLSDSGLKANYVDVKKNIVIVELENNSQEKQKWFKENVIDSNLIKFIQSDKEKVLSANYNVGGNFKDCSMAYRAKKDGKNVFVTAAHCVEGLKDEDVSEYGSIVGFEYSMGGTIDAAIIQLASGNSVSNSIKYPTYPATSISTKTSIYPNPLVVGTIIAKSGVKTHATSGKITNTNFSGTTDRLYLTQTVATDCRINGGDSGGLVYVPTKYDTFVMGVVHSRIKSSMSDDGSGEMVYTRADFIDDYFDLTRY